jgi:hypothetical protein
MIIIFKNIQKFKNIKINWWQLNPLVCLVLKILKLQNNKINNNKINFIFHYICIVYLFNFCKTIKFFEHITALVFG